MSDNVNHPAHYTSHPSGVEWKAYPSDDRYEVSTLGAVRRRGGSPRKPSITPTGYHLIVFSVPGGKHVARYVHRMVLETFVSPCPDGKQASHLNGDKSDNRLDNLCYETPKQNHARKVFHGTDFNGERNPAAKLTESNVIEIRSSQDTENALARRHGVSRATIGRVRRGDSWKKQSEVIYGRHG